jgi:uncharacterized hydantoinase/oxoprolinase family protein
VRDQLLHLQRHKPNVGRTQLLRLAAVLLDQLVRRCAELMQDVLQGPHLGVHVLAGLDEVPAHHAAHLVQLDCIDRHRDLLPQKPDLCGL